MPVLYIIEKMFSQSDLDTALDDLINTLGSPEENEPPAPTYTGPEVSVWIFFYKNLMHEICIFIITFRKCGCK